MEQAGEYRIAAPRPRVWEALNDPEVLKRCIEGCEALTRSADDTLQATVRARIGPVSAVFNGEVTLKDLDPPKSYTLEVSAKGGAAGFARGTARVSLAEAGAETVLSYTAEGRVGGKLAQIGQRLVDAAARKTADDFFEAFARELAPATTEAATQAAPAKAGAAGGGMMRWGFVVAAAVIAAFLVWRLLGR